MSKTISIIVAMAQNRAIGKDNRLLWHIPADLKRFKKLTSGHAVIMGKRTYESLPVRPLPNRTNIVLTDHPEERIDGCVMAFSLEDAVAKCPENDESFVIGGGSVYRQFMQMAGKLYITLVHRDYEADTFFPEIDPAMWKEVSREHHEAEGNLDTGFSYIIYERRG
ncbi:MAG TPA: dihydrofolate reductase [Bacteroidetes bacterium]|nr:dihydrofolate reductase [Bacteroidota bacterium]